MENDIKNLTMESDIKNLTKVWIIAILSICYCYYISSQIPKGFRRLFSLFPIISLFTLLPLSLSTVHFCGITALYLVWLGNSKLILFAFDLGPLSGPKTLIQFLSSSLLPIKFTEKTQNKTSRNYFVVAVKVLALAIVVCSYEYREILPESFIYVLYSFNLYLAADLVLGMSSALVRLVFGLQIEPQFDEPYLATSLQDFWGRRWNLMVSSILRPTVYFPTLDYTSRLLNVTYARALATFAAFLVSGLMHELIYYYVTRVAPTWEVTLYFVLQGVSTSAEVAAKKAAGVRNHLPKKNIIIVAVSRLLTIGYVIVTGVWLFFPQIVRNEVDLKAIGEYHVLIDFVRAKLPMI